MCSMLATLLGEGTSSQVDTNSPVRMPYRCSTQEDDTEEEATHWMNYFSCVMRCKLLMIYLMTWILF